MRTPTLAFLITPALALASCQSAPSSKPRGVATPAQAAALDQVKALAGTWDILDDKGQSTGTTVFTVSSAGSSVREVMFQGHPHEMTNMYHMDGPTMVVTHYCAVGNQPLMRASPADIAPGRIAFHFDRASNFDPKAGGHIMGDLTLVIQDQDHIRQEWASYESGKPAGKVNFELARRK